MSLLDCAGGRKIARLGGGANCGRLMPPGAALCPAFGGAFTVRFVTFSVVMGDGTDLNVTAAIGPRNRENFRNAVRGKWIRTPGTGVAA